MGKFNIHRYMNLYKELGITHSVLADRDENKNIHGIVNGFIDKQKNEFTRAIDYFDKDIETFLDIATVERRNKKPLNVMWHYFKDRIDDEKIQELKDKVVGLV